ncbi:MULTISPECIES: DUF1120 domain-containing protein [Enterobacter]|uniref:DUF1120 domain-containing protein n=1 Tax=Enterobacter cancerogenus TaxID=69218 RepID=UPI0001826565|nr:DUF1120 domain-containing protein [Enterobacter cancerogenus]EFC57784.1 hypothetical protein ENTCAN_05220 [Enterobacter cancerogenus ATCC 35316]
MKKLLVATAISMAMSVTAAHAADTAVLKVQGKLTNASCTPTLSNGGIVDYGTIRLGELNATATNQLGERDSSLTITCSSPTKVGWSITDDRTDSVSPNVNVKVLGDLIYPTEGIAMGLGKTTGGVAIGNWALYVAAANVTADGEHATLVKKADAQSPWENATIAPVLNAANHTVMSVILPEATTPDPMAFTQVVYPLKTSVAIDKTSRLAITDDTQLDGQATITLTYL